MDAALATIGRHLEVVAKDDTLPPTRAPGRRDQDPESRPREIGIARAKSRGGARRLVTAVKLESPVSQFVEIGRQEFVIVRDAHDV